MGRHYQILLPLLSLFLVRVDLTDLFTLQYEARIVKVLDGDTVMVQYGHRIEKLRFSRIDAPELGQPFVGSNKDAGEESLRCVKSILNRKSYRLEIEKRDIYGRLLGDLDNVSFEFVEKGCVSLYPHATFSSQKEKFQYLRAWQKARDQKRGLWKFGGYRQPKLWRKKKFSKQASHPQLRQ